MNSSGEFTWQPIGVDIIDVTDVLTPLTSRHLDVEPDMAAKTVLCVNTRSCTARLYTPQDYVVNTDLMFEIFIDTEQKWVS